MTRRESCIVTKNGQAIKVVHATSTSVDAGSHTDHIIRFEVENSSRKPHDMSSADINHSNTEEGGSSANEEPEATEQPSSVTDCDTTNS